ncbi:YlbF family regulator [Fontivita pretiosa]|jgi:cell fate (sporulation/competence/biofilm development) regulator YlbF (YheA/YmcA/DUF963 family)|uniref:YlbF family regulator n=1 Tax=Fontivita pretiosa TaxID=2989684 RepID=UPI003D17BE98
MATETSEIIAAAEKLGQLIAQHPAVARYRDAQRAVAQDPEASRLMSEFGQQLEKLARQEQSGMGITDAQRQQLEAIQARLASNLKIKALNMAEVEFTDLLRRVSQAWQRPIFESAGGAPAAVGAAAGAGARLVK